MKAWKLDQLGGTLSYVDVPIPEVRPGTVLVRMEAQSLMTYLKPYVEGKLPMYRAPQDFTPGGNGVGRIEEVGRDVWHLKRAQRVIVSSHIVSRENVQQPAQILLGVTSPGGAGDDLQRSWKDGTLAEFVLLPADAVTPVEGLDHLSAVDLVPATRCIVPYGGLVRGRLAAGETVVINGATGAYGTAATFVALALGAARVVVAGRNFASLEKLAKLGGDRVTPCVLTGDLANDVEELRRAAGGGAHLAFDMVGGASDPNSTLAGLGSLYRAGRLVLMGSCTVPLPINYMQLMFNNLEVIGNFMHPKTAYLPLLALIRSGSLDLSSIRPKAFALADLSEAMDYATKANNLEIVSINN